jgi:translation elongation factor P/translation initiation factor 5A
MKKLCWINIASQLKTDMKVLEKYFPCKIVKIFFYQSRKKALFTSTHLRFILSKTTDRKMAKTPMVSKTNQKFNKYFGKPYKTILLI